MVKWIALLAVTAMVVPGYAELQNVEVGGKIEINAVYADPLFDGDHSVSFVEQRTRLNFRADFTDDVTAFIEFDASDDWGEDFRSDYVTGADGRAATGDDVEVHQAYIQTCGMFGTPVTLRIGRQEILLGSGWLVGPNEVADIYTGLSFDAIRATYAADSFSVDAFWAKLNERSPVEEDGDVDLYGVYASCTAVDDMVIDLYWLMVRDAREIEDTPTVFLADWVEHSILNVDDYDPTVLHTVGARVAGTWNAFDYEGEIAFQFGEAGQVGQLFGAPSALFAAYGDDSADWDEWAGHFEVGYTFDMAWTPRVYVGGQYYGGEDERALSFWEWVNPFAKADASVSFNRLFSDYEVDAFLDGSGLSNFWLANMGVTACPTEALEIGIDVLYLEVVEPMEIPWGLTIDNLLGTTTRLYIPLLPMFPFVTQESDDDLGWQATLYTVYAYSEDLSFEAGWTHYFVGDGVADGSFLDDNALTLVGDFPAEDDADYFWWTMSVEF